MVRKTLLLSGVLLYVVLLVFGREFAMYFAASPSPPWQDSVSQSDPHSAALMLATDEKSGWDGRP